MKRVQASAKHRLITALNVIWKCCGHVLIIFPLALLDGVDVGEHHLARGGVFHSDTISSAVANVHDTDLMETVSTIATRQQGSQSVQPCAF